MRLSKESGLFLIIVLVRGFAEPRCGSEGGFVS